MQQRESVHAAQVQAGRRLANYLSVMTMEAQVIARACGKSHLHNLEPEDLVALTLEASARGSATITLQDVELMVPAAKQRSLHELTDAISRKNAPEALALLAGDAPPDARRTSDLRPHQLLLLLLLLLVGSSTWSSYLVRNTFYCYCTKCTLHSRHPVSRHTLRCLLRRCTRTSRSLSRLLRRSCCCAGGLVHRLSGDGDVSNNTILHL